MKTCRTLFALLLIVGFARAQAPDRTDQISGINPLYRLTVVGRTIQAVNYAHRSEPTKIDLRGTVLQPDAHGEATVESKRGSTIIDAKIEDLSAPTKFGLQYLTYVLWAITPDGRALNLGEVVTDHSDNAKLHVTTNFPAFGIIATAEPYSAVTRPSGVVVMENIVRPDTEGKIQAINAKYELLSPDAYTYDPSNGVQPEGKALPMHQYEAVVAVYQALNAVQIAKAEGADRYAKETFDRAERLLEQAEASRAVKSDWKQTVATAREAAQAAEDARAITARRTEAESLGMNAEAR